ncbi:MAG TPA: glycosyltransferase family 1 protein [Dehalococcoidia bacterium]|nr:glycosyltransferase family 1 protein [Dehalococcoidia bacterium]
MNTLYEVSYLGYNYADPRFHTGIPRVIMTFLDHLAEQPEVEPRFVAFEEYIAQLGFENYIDRCTPFSQEQVIRAWSRRFAPERVCRLLTRQFPYRDQSRAREPRYRRGLRRLFRLIQHEAVRGAVREPVDVYHSLYFALPRDERVRAKVRVLSVYDLIPVRFPQFFPRSFDTDYFAAIMKSACRESDWVLCISESTRRDFCAFTGKDPRQVVAVPLGADRRIFHRETDPARLAAVRARYALPQGQYALGLFTIEPRKNVQHLIETFVALIEQERLPDTHLVLVGAKGWDVEHIYRGIAAKPAYRDRVRFTGRIPDADLAAVYSGASFFVYPSLYEGFGLPPLEAMQCGVPVLTSDSSSLPEVVGNAGLMVDPTDGPALAQAMLTLFRDAELRCRLSAAGLVRAQQFSWSRHAAGTVDVYRQALAAC